MRTMRMPTVTQSSIARQLGLSQGTVSRALNHDCRIPAATREQVCKSAQEMGYRRDPEVSKLMSRLRSKKKRAFRGQVRVIDFHDMYRVGTDNFWWAKKVVEGFATAMANEGYEVTVHSFDSSKQRIDSVEKQFRSQGVEGLLLLPTGPRAEPDTNFEQFSIVWIGAQTRTQRFHQVSSDHYHGMVLTLENALRHWRERAGLVLLDTTSRGTRNRWLSGYQLRRFEQPDLIAPPLIWNPDDPDTLDGWLRKERLRTIICSDCEQSDIVRRISGSPALGGEAFRFVDLSRHPRGSFPGINQKPSEIGATAASVLLQLMLRGYRGYAPTPRQTSIVGEWVD